MLFGISNYVKVFMHNRPFEYIHVSISFGQDFEANQSKLDVPAIQIHQMRYAEYRFSQKEIVDSSSKLLP